MLTRCLFSFLATLVIRACVGMAYPINNPDPEAPTRLEEIKAGILETTIQHDDIHWSNSMCSTPGNFRILYTFLTKFKI